MSSIGSCLRPPRRTHPRQRTPKRHTPGNVRSTARGLPQETSAHSSRRSLRSVPLSLMGCSSSRNRAEVSAADPKAAGSETYLELRGRTRLMYLGRSGSSLVLYDASRQSSWQIPSSLFTVRSVNCEEHVQPRDPVCPD